MFTPSCTESKEKQSPSTHRKTQHDIHDSRYNRLSLSHKVPSELMQHTQNDFLWQHTQIQIKGNWMQGHMAGSSPFFFFWSLDTETLYLCLSDRVSFISLSVWLSSLLSLSTGKHSWDSALLPNHFTLSDPFFLPLRHVYPPPSLSLSLAAMIICCCIIKKNKSENLSCCFINEPQRLFSLCVSNTLSIMLHQRWKHNVVCSLQRKANLIQQSQRPCNYLLGYSFIDVRFVLGVCVCKSTVFLLSPIN